MLCCVIPQHSAVPRPRPSCPAVNQCRLSPLWSLPVSYRGGPQELPCKKNTTCLPTHRSPHWVVSTASSVMAATIVPLAARMKGKVAAFCGMSASRPLAAVTKYSAWASNSIHPTTVHGRQIPYIRLQCMGVQFHTSHYSAYWVGCHLRIESPPSRLPNGVAPTGGSGCPDGLHRLLERPALRSVAAALTASSPAGVQPRGKRELVMELASWNKTESARRHGGGGRSLHPADCAVEQIVAQYITSPT
jgi:hypothetical protein